MPANRATTEDSSVAAEGSSAQNGVIRHFFHQRLNYILMEPEWKRLRIIIEIALSRSKSVSCQISLNVNLE